ncbi:uncharacterized protein PAC_01432 [Phialocephala subalpina]|uniref:Glycosyltransferase family 92 protein n=1 Tax=Phialocephala subalpina TaxID=576137 RepID=A0A1L7WFM0_9HELO|nr:uncharacterized protein PAC_01432 [Phialocephala subalpina]
MLLDTDLIQRISQWIKWRYVLVVTVCLMGIRLLFATAKTSLASTDPRVIRYRQKSEPTTPSATSRRPSSAKYLQNFAILQGEIVEEKVWPFETAVPVPYDALPADEYVAVCMAVKDQSHDMDEFLAHHYYNHNVRRFYIMDDCSDPLLSSFEYPNVPRAALTFTYESQKTRVNHMQMVFYKACLERYSAKHKWIAFLDADEYIETPGTETFREVLESFEHNSTVGALGTNWKVHPSSGVKTRPLSARKAFDEYAFGGNDSIDRYVKSVVKTSLAAGPLNPHKFKLQGSAQNRIHHYAIRSEEEFEEKLHRGNGMTEPQSKVFWEKVEYEMEKVNCTEMVDYDP